MKYFVVFIALLWSMLCHASDFDAELLRLTNAERSQYGLSALTLNSQLGAAAQNHAVDMAQNNYFDHTGLNGSTPAIRATTAGYKYSYVGENIAAGYATPVETIAQWMNSEGHRANILNVNYTEIGFGYAYQKGSDYRHYWVQVFGKSSGSTTPVTPTTPTTSSDFWLTSKAAAIAKAKKENKYVLLVACGSQDNIYSNFFVSTTARSFVPQYFVPWFSIANSDSSDYTGEYNRYFGDFYSDGGATFPLVAVIDPNTDAYIDGYRFRGVSNTDQEVLPSLQTLAKTKGYTTTPTTPTTPTTTTGFTITSDIWINAKINTVEKGLVNAVWKLGGSDSTSRGDKVIWGYFHANPNDVSWGSEDNPDVFVKVWFDASGRIDVNYFHVSVPDIQVYSRKSNGSILSGTANLNARYVRHYFDPNGTQQSISESPQEVVKQGIYSDIVDTFPLAVPTSVINTVELGGIDGKNYTGGSTETARGDFVIWGYSYADPAKVTWGSKNNPEVFYKIWRDAPSLRYDANFFHVSVPDIKVASTIAYVDSNGDAQHIDMTTHRESTATLKYRYVRHEYQFNWETDTCLTVQRVNSPEEKLFNLSFPK